MWTIPSRKAHRFADDLHIHERTAALCNSARRRWYIHMISETKDAISCVRLDASAARDLYRSALAADFPPAELRPIEWIEPLLDAGSYRAYLLCQGEAQIAYAFLCRSPDQAVWLVDYLAVFAPYRGLGFGSALLRALHEAFAADDALLFEVDHPDFADDEPERIKRERRIAFYSRGGVRDTGVTTCVCGCEFRILALPERAVPTGEAAACALDGIYRRLFPASFYASEVVFHAPYARPTLSESSF